MEKSMKLLIGYDESANTGLIIEDMKLAGFPSRVEATVLSVADVILPPPIDKSTPPQFKTAIEKSREQAKEALRITQSLAEHGAEEIKLAFPGWEIHPETCADSPAWALIKKAEEWRPDLIVVGAHGHSRIGRFIGSVSQMVVIQAPCSVRVTRSRPNPKDNPRILVGVDGSPDAESAINAVATRSWPAHVEVMLVSIIDPKMSSLLSPLTPSVIHWFLEHSDDERTVVGRMLESYAKKLREKGAVVTCLVQSGDPKRMLVDQAETWRADSIFIGARGLSSLKRFFVGGVSAAVAARAHCSVEVIRATH